MVFEFSIGLICLTTGVIFLWLWRKISKNEYLEIEALDYLYVSLICLGAAIYAGAFTPLFGNISQSKIYEALTERASLGRRVPVPALLAILTTTLVGVLDECIQAFLPSRVFDPIDMLFNFLAGTMSVVASVALAWARRRFR